MREPTGSHGTVLHVGTGGWVRYRAEALNAPIFARVAEAPDGRLEVADLFIPFNSPPSARSFRTLGEHLSRIAAMVNAEGVAVPLRVRIATTSDPDLRAVVSRHAPESDQPRVRAHPELLLDVPSARPYPDEFYAEVGRAYADAAAWSSRPGAAIATVNDVPVKTVHRWVAEARRRGHLAPGRKGRAG